MTERGDDRPDEYSRRTLRTLGTNSVGNRRSRAVLVFIRVGL